MCVLISLYLIIVQSKFKIVALKFEYSFFLFIYGGEKQNFFSQQLLWCWCIPSLFPSKNLNLSNLSINPTNLADVHESTYPQ